MQTGLAGEENSAENLETDTPLTDALVDQFASYYLLAVIAVKALEALREQRRISEAAIGQLAGLK